LLRGGDGNDVLIGNFGSDVLLGGKGDDMILGDNPQDPADPSHDACNGQQGTDFAVEGTCERPRPQTDPEWCAGSSATWSGSASSRSVSER
jgi:Ca2+-binding RTX toxin-like protein